MQGCIAKACPKSKGMQGFNRVRCITIRTKTMQTRRSVRGAPKTLSLSKNLKNERQIISFYSRTGWRWLEEELQWVQDEAARRDNNDEEGQGPTVSEKAFGSRKSKVEERYERTKRQRRESAAGSGQEKQEKMSGRERIKKRKS